MSQRTPNEDRVLAVGYQNPQPCSGCGSSNCSRVIMRIQMDRQNLHFQVSRERA